LLRTVHTRFTAAKVLFERVPARDAARFDARTAMAAATDWTTAVGAHDRLTTSEQRSVGMNTNSFDIPESLRHDCQEIFKLTDSFCAEHLDSEYGRLCRKLIAKLARKRPSPLARGDLRTWAAAAIYAVGSINFLFDSSQDIFMTGDQISLLTGIPKSTLSNKAKQIRDSLKLYQMHPEFSRRKLLANSPIPWLVDFNGLIVDARTLPLDVQAEARRKGLIPDLDPE
jgi:hypothetical protein